MSIALYALSAITVITSLLCITQRILRNKKNNMVFQTKGFWIVNIAAVYSSVLLSVFCYQNEELQTLIPFILMAILSLVSNIAFCNEIVVFEDERFFVRNFWRYKRYYNYADVRGFLIKKRKYRNITEINTKFYVGNKHFSILTSSYNYDIFFDKLNSEYKKYNAGKNMPQLRNKL